MIQDVHFDACQFDKPSALADFSGLGKLIENGKIGAGFQIVKERKVEHDVPDWAMTWAGLARVALCYGGLEVQTKRGKHIVNHQRRVSVLYSYFRLGMSADYISEYLDVKQTDVEGIIQRTRKSFNDDDPQTDYGETAQLRHAVKRFMLGWEKDLSGTRPAEVEGTGPGLALPLETPKELRAKRAERKLEPEVWNYIRMKGLAALGANLRARRRSEWKTSDTPLKFILPMLGNLGRKMHRAARVQLKAKVMRRLDDLGENATRLPSRRCRHGIYGADTCAVCLVLPDSAVWADLKSS